MMRRYNSVEKVVLEVGFVLLCFMASCSTLWGQRYTVHGYVTEALSGEPLIGATVKDLESGAGAITDSYGRYSLTLRGGSVALQSSYVGHKPQECSFVLKADTLLSFALHEQGVLDEVTVVGHYNPSGVSTPQMSAISVPIELIKKMPSIFGEQDVLKTLQLLPGVQGGTEGMSGIYVRGGGPDQNLFMMDGISIYNVNHMGGIFSNFNPDAVKNVTLFKGSFPARFGGRLSSVVDVRMKDGDDKKIRGNYSVGLISSKVNVEGPIIKEKTTFNLSARRTYYDLLIRPALWIMSRRDAQEEGLKGVQDAGYYFYDLNAKITHKIDDQNKLFFTGYLGEDVLFLKTKTSTAETAIDEEGDEILGKGKLNLGWRWGNAIAALRWNRVLNPQMFLNTTAAFNRYNSHLKLRVKAEGTKGKETSSATLASDYNSGIQDLMLRSELSYTPHHKHQIQTGVEYVFHTFKPDVSSVKLSGNIDLGEIGSSVFLSNDKPHILAHELGLYAEDNISFTKRIEANAGLRYSLFAVQGRVYHSLEPRGNIMVKLAEGLSAKLGYAMMTQYIHLLSTNSVSLPTDLWVPATKRISPMRSHQIAGGFYYTLPQWGDFSVEGYYKKMINLLEYKDGASFLLESQGWEDMVAMGDGKAYGLELLWQRSVGNTTGWVAYTWSRSLKQFNRLGQELNNGKVFPAKYDRIHDFTIAFNHQLCSWIDLSASWVFRTGNAGTLQEQKYEAIIPDETNGWSYFNSKESSYESQNYRHTEVEYVPSRNNFRFPNYHRLDLSVNFYKKHKRSGRLSTWNVSIYNAYVQQNPFLIEASWEFVSDKQTGSRTEMPVYRYVTLLPIVPTVSYSCTF